MPVYTYRREDGTTFEIQQRFMDDPLTVDPETGQSVVRIVQATGIIFKGSGFYVNDSRSASKKNISTTSSSTNGNGNGSSDNGSSETKAETKTETKSESKSEKSSSSVSSTAAD